MPTQSDWMAAQRKRMDPSAPAFPDDPANVDERRADLAKLRALGVQRSIPSTKPGIFADSATTGLQRPVAGAVSALDFWNHPDTNMSERFHGGMDKYSEDLARQIAQTHPISAMAQSVAGGLVMGGPEGSLLKQGAFDAGTAGVQEASGGGSYEDILASMLMNAGMGGVVNAAGKGVGKVREYGQAMQEMLQNVGRR